MIRHLLIAALLFAAPVWADEVYDFTFQKADAKTQVDTGGSDQVSTVNETKTEAEDQSDAPASYEKSIVEIGPSYFSNGWYNERGLMASYAYNFTERFSLNADMILILSQSQNSYEDSSFGTESEYPERNSSPRLAIGVGFAPVLVHASNGATAFSLSFLTGLTSFEELVQQDYCTGCGVRTNGAPYVGAKMYVRLAGPVGLSFQARYIVATTGNSPSEEALAVTFKF